MTTETSVKHIELTEVSSQANEEVVLSSREFKLVKSVPVEVDVSLGTSSVTLKQLFALKAGEVLSLNKQVDEPVNLVVDGHVVAMGNLVAVDGQFGIEITEIME